MSNKRKQKKAIARLRNVTILPRNEKERKEAETKLEKFFSGKVKRKRI